MFKRTVGGASAKACRLERPAKERSRDPIDFPPSGSCQYAGMDCRIARFEGWILNRFGDLATVGERPSFSGLKSEFNQASKALKFPALMCSVVAETHSKKDNR